MTGPAALADMVLSRFEYAVVPDGFGAADAHPRPGDLFGVVGGDGVMLRIGVDGATGLPVAERLDDAGGTVERLSLLSLLDGCGGLELVSRPCPTVFPRSGMRATAHPFWAGQERELLERSGLR